MLKAGLRRLRKITGNYYRRTSYSQCGEDIVVWHLIEKLGLKDVSYLDIGTNHPIHFNNTFLLYKKGFSGVCVEPDPSLCKAIRTYRRRDKVLNVGISAGQENTAPFYVMSVNTLNTFAKEDAEKLHEEGIYTIRKVIEVPLKNVNNIITENFNGRCPEFVSIDVEGWNEEIVRSFDFKKWRPEIMCIETTSFATDNSEVKLKSLIDYVLGQGYVSYADTNINTIFYKEESLK